MVKKDNFITDDDFKIKPKNLKLITLTCLILTIIIQIIHNTNWNPYIKNFIIPLGVMLGGYIFLINKNDLIKNKKAYALLIPIVLILLSDIVINIDITNKILNVFILPVLLATFFFLLINKNYKISKDSLNWIFKLFPRDVINNNKYIRKISDSIKNPQTKMALNIFVGLMISVPIVVVLIYLLTNADKYFGEFISFILSSISSLFNIKLLFNNILVLFITFVILFGVFVNILKNKDTRLREVTYREVNNTIISTILIIVNAVFVLFVISELSKLTINFLHLPIEYTYAEYAREGFFQLLVVTAINFAIILYYIYYTKIVENSNFIKKLLVLLVAFSIILVFNSYYRMFLYIQAYGFTILRLQVILFLAMELFLFIILIKKVIGNLKNEDATLFTAITLLFYIFNLYLCSDWFVNLLGSF